MRPESVFGECTNLHLNTSNPAFPSYTHTQTQTQTHTHTQNTPMCTVLCLFSPVHIPLAVLRQEKSFPLVAPYCAQELINPWHSLLFAVLQVAQSF
jgi:hypothetical protein